MNKLKRIVQNLFHSLSDSNQTKELSVHTVQVIEVQLQKTAKLGRVDTAWEFGIMMNRTKMMTQVEKEFDYFFKHNILRMFYYLLRDYKKDKINLGIIKDFVFVSAIVRAAAPSGGEKPMTLHAHPFISILLKQQQMIEEEEKISFFLSFFLLFNLVSYCVFVFIGGMA